MQRSVEFIFVVRSFIRGLTSPVKIKYVLSIIDSFVFNSSNGLKPFPFHDSKFTPSSFLSLRQSFLWKFRWQAILHIQFHRKAQLRSTDSWELVKTLTERWYIIIEQQILLMGIWCALIKTLFEADKASDIAVFLGSLYSTSLFWIWTLDCRKHQIGELYSGMNKAFTFSKNRRRKDKRCALVIDTFECC